MITKAQAAMLLAKVAAVDNRIQSIAAVMVWAEALQDLTIDECIDAVDEHRRNSPGVYLEPGHVRAIVKARRADRADRRAADQHHEAIAAVPYEQSSAHKAYLEAGPVLQKAIRDKYERLGQPIPNIPADPFRRWTPKADAG
jgi:hypothetical protein